MLSISQVNNVSFKANLMIENNLRNNELFKSSEFAKDEMAIVDSFKKETVNFPNHEIVIMKDSGGFAEFLLKKDKEIVAIKSIPFFKYSQYQHSDGLLKVFHHMRLDGEYKNEQTKIKEKYQKEMEDVEAKYRLRLNMYNL